MKRFFYICAVFLFAVAGCATGSTEIDDGDFVAPEIAGDANRDNTVTQEDRHNLPLTADEEGEAALLISQLEATEDDAERDTIIETLVANGPRFLSFYRAVESDASMLDMMYIVRRIEREFDVRKPSDETVDAGTEGNNTGGNTDGNAGESGPTIPDYSDDLENFDQAEVDKFLKSRLSQAKRMLDGGRFEPAIRIAEAAITLVPDSSLRPEFDALIARARGESQAELLIAGNLTLSPDALRYARQAKGANFVEALDIRCFLKNVSTEEIILRLYEGEGRESILQLGVTYEQLDYLGNSMAQRGNVSLPVDAGATIRLLPNESYELTVPLESLASLDSDASQKNALGRVTIDAALRVYGAANGDGEPIVLRAISFPARTVYVFPATFDLDGAQKRPLSTFRDALKNGEPQTLFLAAHLIGKRERRIAGDELIEDFERSVLAMQHARLKALSIVFGTGRNWSIKRWQEWWDENRLRN